MEGDAGMSAARLPQAFRQNKILKYHADHVGPYTDNRISTINFYV